jgi:mannose-6-phosphate isomerase-like protein (cupin superfamily)
MTMSFKKFRWSKVYESSEEELMDFLKAHNIKSKRIHAEANAEQSEQYTEKDTTLWCAEGSLVINIDSATISLQPGDALRIDADTTYSVHAGIAGFAYCLSY